jgi:hypothetical protein
MLINSQLGEVFGAQLTSILNVLTLQMDNYDKFEW